MFSSTGIMRFLLDDVRGYLPRYLKDGSKTKRIGSRLVSDRLHAVTFWSLATICLTLIFHSVCSCLHTRLAAFLNEVEVHNSKIIEHSLRLHGDIDTDGVYDGHTPSNKEEMLFRNGFGGLQEKSMTS